MRKQMSGHYALAIALAFIAISTPDLVLRRDVLFLGELATGRAVVPARHIHETELEIARDNGMSLVFVPYANIQELRNDLIVTDAGYFEDVKVSFDHIVNNQCHYHSVGLINRCVPPLLMMPP